jgi:hypothetical protein
MTCPQGRSWSEMPNFLVGSAIMIVKSLPKDAMEQQEIISFIV